MRRVLCSLLLLLAFPVRAEPWEQLEPGLELQRFPACSKAVVGDSTLTIVRVDPAYFDIRVLSASEGKDGQRRTAPMWAHDFGLLITTNAGMFATDFETHVGYLRVDATHVNSTTNVRAYKSVLAWSPRSPSLAEVAMFDLEDVPLTSIEAKYQGVVQNLRLVRHPGKNVWGPSERKWSEAALGLDTKQRVLFIFSRSPYSMHDLNACLLQLPIGLLSAQHLEGGPEASLALRSATTSLDLVGSYETGFNENDENQRAYPLPNVIGVVRRTR